MAGNLSRIAPNNLIRETLLPNEHELALKISRAFKSFFANEETLLEVNASERSITHKLAEYLQKEFQHKGLKVDCEYNRHGQSTKRITNLDFGLLSTDDQEAKTVFPDIIVHKRKTDEYNVLVIEIKKSTSSDNYDNDVSKLEAFTKQSGDYRYKLGLFVLLDIERKQIGRIRCFKDGNEVETAIIFNLKELGFGW
jgi:hypothetical protein